MDQKELFELVFRLACINLFLVCAWDLFKRARALVKAKCATYCVKTVFMFDRGKNHKVGDLTYYLLSEVDKYIEQNRLQNTKLNADIYETILSSIQQVPVGNVFGTNPPARVVVSKDILEKYKQIIVTSDCAVVMLNKVTTGDCAYWTGTCSISDNNDFARLIAKKLIKEKRNDPTCHVVRP